MNSSMNNQENTSNTTQPPSLSSFDTDQLNSNSDPSSLKESTSKIHSEYSSSLSLSPSDDDTPSTPPICPLLNERAFDCPICLDLLCEPLTLSCGHTYCQHCIKQFIAKSHTLSKQRLKKECKCPSCKAIIENKFKHSVSFTLREFLKNQFTERYKERYFETESERDKYNKLMIKLKEKEDEEIALLQKCCGIVKLKRWIIHNFDLMFNQNLNRNSRSWLIGWLVLYFIVLGITLQFIIPVITKIHNSFNNTSSRNTSLRNASFSLYFLEDMFQVLGINSISQVSSITFGPILHSIMSVLQYFGAIGSTTNTEYLPNNYIINSVLDYNTFGNIYDDKYSTDLYYKQLFTDWRSGELKRFLRRYDIENTCVERQCYTEIILKYLKESEWNKLVNDNDFEQLPISVLQKYLNHYNVNYDECYNSFWSKDYQCFAEKAASIKIMNDVYYGKEKLLSSSYKARQARNKKKYVKQNERQQTRQNDDNDNNYNHHQHNRRQQRQQRPEDEPEPFWFHNIGNTAFNILSGLR